MSLDPPKYRPLERFWPYAELPEQPTDEELASLDPDLQEALFGRQPRPFSITLVFATLDVPEFPRRSSWRANRPSSAKPGAAPLTGTGRASGRPRPRRCATCSRSSAHRM